MTKTNEIIKDYLINQDFNKKTLLEPKMNKLVREYLIKQGFNNKPLLDILVEGIINNDISEWRTLLNNNEIRDLKQIMRDYKLFIILDNIKYDTTQLIN